MSHRHHHHHHHQFSLLMSRAVFGSETCPCQTRVRRRRGLVHALGRLWIRNNTRGCRTRSSRPRWMMTMTTTTMRHYWIMYNRWCSKQHFSVSVHTPPRTSPNDVEKNTTTKTTLFRRLLLVTTTKTTTPSFLLSIINRFVAMQCRDGLVQRRKSFVVTLRSGHVCNKKSATRRRR